MSKAVAAQIYENMRVLDIDPMVGTVHEGKNIKPIEIPENVKKGMIERFEAIATPIISARNKSPDLRWIELWDGSLKEDQTNGPNYITDNFIPERVIEKLSFFGIPYEVGSELESYADGLIEEYVGESRDRSVVFQWKTDIYGSVSTLPAEIDNDYPSNLHQRGYRVIIRDDMITEDVHITLCSIIETLPTEENEMSLEYRHQHIPFPTISIQGNGFMVLKFPVKSCFKLRYSIDKREQNEDSTPKTIINQDPQRA